MYYPINLKDHNNIKEEILEKFQDIIDQELVYEKRLLTFSRLDINKCKKIESLNVMLKSFNLLEHVFCTTLTINVKNQSPIHIDPDYHTYSFNIPIKNCDNTYINFYKVEKKYEIKNRFSYGKSSACKQIIDYITFDKKNCKLLSKNNCVIPAIVNTKVPHMFYNIYSKPRIMLLIRLQNSANELVNNIIKKL